MPGSVNIKKLRVALVHGPLQQWGGAEVVLAELLKLFPHADVYTPFINPQPAVQELITNRNVYQSFISHLPYKSRFWKLYIPLFPFAYEQFDLSDYDLVISDTDAFAKGLILPPHVRHISYIHTPPRFLWGLPTSTQDKLNPVLKPLMTLVNLFLRKWDFLAAQRPEILVANSREVQTRIKKNYHRKSQIIHPPTNLENIPKADKTKLPNDIKEPYMLALGRLERYKDFHILVQTWQESKIKKYHLVIAGTGSEYHRLKRMASHNSKIHVIDRVSDSQKWQLYQYSEAFLNPQQEDWGITMVEALACGTPIIAYEAGGALEIVDSSCGIFFKTPKKDGIAKAVREFTQRKESLTESNCRKKAKSFSVKAFRRSFQKLLQNMYN